MYLRYVILILASSLWACSNSDRYPQSVIDVVIPSGEHGKLVDELSFFGTTNGFEVRNLGKEMPPAFNPDDLGNLHPKSQERDVVWLEFHRGGIVNLAVLDSLDGERFAIALYEDDENTNWQVLENNVISFLKERGWFSKVQHYASNNSLKHGTPPVGGAP